MRKPRALRAGDRVALVAPASPFDRDEFERGAAEIRALGFEPVFDERVFARRRYVAGSPSTRAGAFLDAWRDDRTAALIAVRGGYGSVQILPLVGSELAATPPKLFIGYSDTTALLVFLTQQCGTVAIHGPMLEGRLARGAVGYDRPSFMACVAAAEPMGRLDVPALRSVRPGTATGPLAGGNLSQIAASLGTPFAFQPPDGCLLFLEDVSERPYRLDRMVTQLGLAGIFSRARAVIWGEMPRCEETDGGLTALDVVAELSREFNGPVVFGLPSGHTTGACMTLPLGVRATVSAGMPGEPCSVTIEEAAVRA